MRRSYGVYSMWNLLLHTNWNSSSSGSDALHLFNVQYLILTARFSRASDCYTPISLLRISPIVTAVIRGLHSFKSTFSFVWLVLFDLLVGFSILVCSSSGYKYLIYSSVSDFGVHSLTLCMTSALTLKSPTTISVHHIPLFFSSPLILYYSSYCAFREWIANTLFSSFPCCLFKLADIMFASFLFLKYFRLTVFLE